MVGAEHSSHAENLVELLDLEELDRDLYRAGNPVHPLTPHLYGGQVAAQALRAAALTVTPDRIPHSLHGYFLRRGEARRPTIMRVTRDRDGRSFSARHVVAQQNGEAIFTASVSFHVDEPGGDFNGSPLPPDLPAPEDLPASMRLPQLMLELRPWTTRERPPHLERAAPLHAWARTWDPLPDDRVTHACVLTYLSDLSGGFGEIEAVDIPPGGPSLDHAIYFHRPVRADEWLYMDERPLSAAGARGLYTGTIHDARGVLGATFFQETLLRPGAAPRPE